MCMCLCVCVCGIHISGESYEKDVTKYKLNKKFKKVEVCQHFILEVDTY